MRLVGRYVRRKSKNGNPIGPYMQIMHVEDNRVYCDVLGRDEPNVMVLRENIYFVKHARLAVSEYILNRIKSDLCPVQHLATTKWIQALKDNAELVVFYTTDKGYKAIFKVESIRETYNLRDRMIKIEVAEKLSEGL